MDDLIATFLAVTSTGDEATAKQYLEITGGDLEYAVTLYMESNPPQSMQLNSKEDDAAIAQRLQNEAYGEQEVRPADTNVHRHETLMDSFGPGEMGYNLFNPGARAPRPQDIFGTGTVGIFNQRADVDENEFYNRFQDVYDDEDEEEDMDYDDEEAGDNGNVIILDDDDENDNSNNENNDDDIHQDGLRPVGRRRAARNSRLGDLSFTQQRLANLFKPPFDIMSMIDLDSAKLQGRGKQKWILINIQDATEFQCQVLNRDFWSLSRIKLIVKNNFIFLQYQHDLAHGVNYTNFYSTDAFPHIAILDPYTGERVKRWDDGIVPQADEWIAEVEDFLERFSLSPTSQNPVVKHEVKFDPDAMTEEQQIEFAIKQSISNSNGSSKDDPIELLDDPEEPELEQPEPPQKEKDVFLAIIPQNHEEPTTPTTTRVQIRFPNGKRVIHKFDVDGDKVVDLYQWLKYLLQNSASSEYGLEQEDRFTISTVLNKSGKALIELLDTSIGEAGLKNASILLEKE